jgi:hypothetical protein
VDGDLYALAEMRNVVHDAEGLDVMFLDALREGTQKEVIHSNLN